MYLAQMDFSHVVVRSWNQNYPKMDSQLNLQVAQKNDYHAMAKQDTSCDYIMIYDGRHKRVDAKFLHPDSWFKRQ